MLLILHEKGVAKLAKSFCEKAFCFDRLGFVACSNFENIS